MDMISNILVEKYRKGFRSKIRIWTTAIKRYNLPTYRAAAWSLFLFMVFMHFSVSSANDTIKVLMLESASDRQPSEKAEKIDSLNGKVFINGQSYTGSIEIMEDQDGLYVINSIPFEKYIEGVVAAEVGKDWETEALKAQAVISRTYAAYNRDMNLNRDYHLTSSVLHQVYSGENDDSQVEEAVKGTEGEIIVYEGRPVNAFYHSACSGMTELPEEVWAQSYPYLKSVECNCINSPYDRWQKRFSFDELGNAVGIKGLQHIYISSYTATGRAKILKLLYDDNKEMEIKATDLRRLLGYKELPSTNFSVTAVDSEIVFDGRGYGHGVGLSQWGALEMAREGKTYREILSHYYPGTTINRIKEELHSINLDPEE